MAALRPTTVAGPQGWQQIGLQETRPRSIMAPMGLRDRRSDNEKSIGDLA